MENLRLGIVGCGAMAEWHANALLNAHRTRVTACVDVSAERSGALALITGGTACASIDEALAIGVDALAIMVPHHLHETVTAEAFATGVHVVLEKPIAADLESCGRILAAAARRPQQVFMLAENSQYWPEVLIAKQHIEAGAIGDVITARSWHNSPPPPEFYPNLETGAKPWRFQHGAMGGGVALDTGSHWLRPLRMILGELDEVVATTARIWPQMDGESVVRSLCRFRSGIVASFDVMLAIGAVALQPHFQFTGTLGELIITHAGEVRLFDGQDPHGTIVGIGGYMQSYVGVWLDFEAAVLDGRPLAASADFAVGELRAALAINRSAQSRQWEPVW